MEVNTDIRYISRILIYFYNNNKRDLICIHGENFNGLPKVFGINYKILQTENPAGFGNIQKGVMLLC